MRIISLAVLCAACFAFLAGCRTAPKYAAHMDAYSRGRYADSVKVFESDMEDRIDDAGSSEAVKGCRDYALDDMEIGSGYRAEQKFAESLAAFKRAEQGIREQQEENMAKSSTLQVGAVLTNDNVLPYQTQEYDAIMVNTYKALDLLQQGEIDNARVEFRRVEERQRMAVETFQKEIAKAQEEEKAEKSGEPVKSQIPESARAEKKDNGLASKMLDIVADKFNEAKNVVTGSICEGDNKKQMEKYEETFSASNWGAQDAFTNPFSTYMQGLFLLIYGEDQSDAENSVVFFSKVFRTEEVQENNPAAQVLKLADKVADGKKREVVLSDKVFVIFENGLCPEKKEYTLPIVIPLNISGSRTKFVDASLVLPKLVRRTEAFPYLSICDNGTEIAKTITICDMDAVVAAEYRERMPRVLLRNVMQSGVKAVLQAYIIDILDKQGVPNILSSIALSLVFYYTKAADLRIWSSLPKNFQVAVVERPSSGVLQLMAPGNPAPLALVQIPAGGPSIVFTHTPAPFVPLSINVVSKVSK